MPKSRPEFGRPFPLNSIVQQNGLAKAKPLSMHNKILKNGGRNRVFGRLTANATS
jgi:hypothetical protein